MILMPGKGRSIFTEDKEEMDWLKYFYDEAAKGAKRARVRMPKFNQFWDKNQLIEMKVNKKIRNLFAMLLSVKIQL